MDLAQHERWSTLSKGRLEAFSDGVIAILITIMVLELHAPEQPSLAALQPLIPQFLAYFLSFLFLAIYWNNHHHLFQVVRRIRPWPLPLGGISKASSPSGSTGWPSCSRSPAPWLPGLCTSWWR
jgi:hypothetical protein